MRRRIVWRYGDSPPIFGNIVAAVTGDGEIKIYVGFPVSAAEVAFSKVYNRYLAEGYASYACPPEVYVSSVDDDGFTLCYKGIADTLDVNYIVM